MHRDQSEIEKNTCEFMELTRKEKPGYELVYENDLL